MTDFNIYEKQLASSMLDVVTGEPDLWLADVSGLWLDRPALQPWQALFLAPSLPPSPTQGSRAPEATLRQQRGMARATEEMAALHWQHHPHLCPLQVPKIMRCIHENLACIHMQSARQSVEALLLLMANKCPGEVVITLLKIAPRGDRYWP